MNVINIIVVVILFFMVIAVPELVSPSGRSVLLSPATRGQQSLGLGRGVGGLLLLAPGDEPSQSLAVRVGGGTGQRAGQGAREGLRKTGARAHSQSQL